MILRMGTTYKNKGYGLLGIGLFFLIWQILSEITTEIIIASPLSSLLMLVQMAQTSFFWKALGITLARFGISIFLGTSLGFLLGLFAGLKPNIKRLFEPIRWSLMSMPPVVVVSIGMIWFGIGGGQTIFVTSLLILPIMYVSTIEGVEIIEPGLLEMAWVYRANSFQILRHIYLPGMAGPLLSGMILSAGLGIRLIVLAEVLGANTGLGYEFSVARMNLDSPAIFAWILVCLIVVGLFEFGFMGPARMHIMKWKKL